MIVPRAFALTFCVVSIMLSGIRCTTAPAAPIGSDRESLLRDRTWITDSITFNGLDVTTEGVRTLRLETNGAYLSTLHNGTTLEGTWDLSPDGTRLVLDEGAMEESVFDLQEVTSTRLRMSWTGERDEVTGRYDYTARAS